MSVPFDLILAVSNCVKISLKYIYHIKRFPSGWPDRIQNPHMMRNVTIHPTSKGLSRSKGLTPIAIIINANDLEQNEMINSNPESRRRRCCMKFIMIFIVFNLASFLVWLLLRRMIR